MIEGIERLTIVRHAVSVYNESKTTREQNPEYQAFRRAYDQDWQSDETKKLAEKLRKQLVIPGGEDATPILEELAHQAEFVGEYMYETMPNPDLIVVSPYLRTKQTLERMSWGCDPLSYLPRVEDPRIREREHGLMPNYGDRRIFFVNHPGERALFEQGEYDYRYPGGENIEDVKIRVADWLKDINKLHRGLRVLAVTHHETILVMRMLLEELSPEDFHRIDREDKPINCGVTQYRDFGRGLELVSYNQDMFSNLRPRRY